MLKNAVGCIAVVLALVTGAILIGVTGGRSTNRPISDASAATAAPTSPPARVCGTSSILGGPSSAPSGAVTIPAGTDQSSSLDTPGTTYYFAAGTHTVGTGLYSQIDPGTGDTYVGAPGAILSGQDKNNVAFGGNAENVTVEYLTISGFESPEDQGVVNHTAATGWTVEHDTVSTNPVGAGVEIGSNNKVEYNCLTHNGEYGFNVYSTTGTVSNVTLSYNEISDNDGTPSGGGLYDQPGSSNTCGCSGGGKFWNSLNVTVTDNYVHTNGSVGIWADTNNRGFNISDNYIANNRDEGITYEVSYNALISDNTLIGNAIKGGPTVAGFPDSAIYISESGGDSRVASNFSGKLTVTGNVLSDNWGGVVLWENSNRYCGDGSDGACTLVTPSTYTMASCGAHLKGSTPTQTPDYYDNCRWKTQNVTVSGNTFTFTPTAVGSNCTTADYCGFNALFSEYGTTTPWKGWAVPLHISDDQNNHFTDNTYHGPWLFDGFNQGDVVTWAQWTAGFTDGNGSNDHFGAQDAGSTYNQASSSPPATTTTHTPPPATTTTHTPPPATTTTHTPPPATTTTHTPPPATTTTHTPPPATTTTHTPPPATTTTTKGSPTTVPAAPTSLIASGTSGHVSLKWDAPAKSTVASYTVFRGTSGGTEKPLAVDVLKTSYVDSTATKSGVTYYYTVRAVNQVGMGAASNQARVTVRTSHKTGRGRS